MLRAFKHITVFLFVAATVLLLASQPTYGLRVGWNVDIHQNKFTDGANDFHIWGILESGDPDGTNPPTLTGQVNFRTSGPDGIPPWEPGANPALETFNPQIGNPITRSLPPLCPFQDPVLPPFYYFEASWSTTGQFPYC
jgi:hypothetical protein